MHTQSIQDKIDILSDLCRELNNNQDSGFAAYLISMAILELYDLIGAEYSDNDNPPTEK